MDEDDDPQKRVGSRKDHAFHESRIDATAELTSKLEKRMGERYQELNEDNIIAYENREITHVIIDATSRDQNYLEIGRRGLIASVKAAADKDDLARSVHGEEHAVYDEVLGRMHE